MIICVRNPGTIDGYEQFIREVLESLLHDLGAACLWWPATANDLREKMVALDEEIIRVANRRTEYERRIAGKVDCCGQLVGYC